MKAILSSLLIFTCLIIGAEGMGSKGKVTASIETGPPPIVVSAPSALVIMPQNGIYFVPGISYDVFFYDGYWWSPRGDRWYRASEYKGPWGIVEHRQVPGHLYKVPKNYREVYKKEQQINYGQWKKLSQKDKNRGGKH